MNQAIYLTKCGEVATYLLWPCLSRHDAYADDMREPFVRLWKLGCRDRFWVKKRDLNTRTVYVNLLEGCAEGSVTWASYPWSKIE